LGKLKLECSLVAKALHRMECCIQASDITLPILEHCYRYCNIYNAVAIAYNVSEVLKVQSCMYAECILLGILSKAI